MLYLNTECFSQDEKEFIRLFDEASKAGTEGLFGQDFEAAREQTSLNRKRKVLNLLLTDIAIQAVANGKEIGFGYGFYPQFPTWLSYFPSTLTPKDQLDFILEYVQSEFAQQLAKVRPSNFRESLKWMVVDLNKSLKPEERKEFENKLLNSKSCKIYSQANLGSLEEVFNYIRPPRMPNDRKKHVFLSRWLAF